MGANADVPVYVKDVLKASVKESDFAAALLAKPRFTRPTPYEMTKQLDPPPRGPVQDNCQSDAARLGNLACRFDTKSGGISGNFRRCWAGLRLLGRSR
jgi:hypothetical protein